MNKGINIIFDEYDIFFSDWITKRLFVRFFTDLPEITSFCRTKQTSLRKVDVTYENMRPELIYYFSNNLGGYLINAVRH